MGKGETEGHDGEGITSKPVTLEELAAMGLDAEPDSSTRDLVTEFFDLLDERHRGITEDPNMELTEDGVVHVGVPSEIFEEMKRMRDAPVTAEELMPPSQRKDITQVMQQVADSTGINLADYVNLGDDPTDLDL